MSAENQKRINVSFDNGSANNGSANITITETINGTPTSTSISIPINDHTNDYTNLNYNATSFTTDLGESVTKLGLIQSYMMLRTICDIRKDATNATIPVYDRNYLTLILKQIFPDNLVDQASLPKLEEIKAISNDNCKEYISGRVFIKSAYTDHIPIPVTHVFNESGAKPDTFIPSNANTRIMSSFASVADPATRTDPTESFPRQNVGLQFDESFMELVGFLKETRWYAVQTSEFDINNSNNTKYSFSINVGNDGGIVSGNNVKNSDIAITPFSGDTGYYFQGNPTKNKFINNNPISNRDKLAEILKYMIIKEMGDMMQVYVMLVWFYLEQKNEQMTKEKFVMSTTDLVVMNTCQLFQMPCLYTNQGKDNSMLTGEDKTKFELIYKEKIAAKANGRDEYNNWKKNNKFANTLYYLPITENGLDKLKRRLNTIYHVINSQNEKQLTIFIMASKNIDKLRYIKMGRSGPLMTSFFSNLDIIKSVIAIIIENILNINHNLLVDYDAFCNDLNKIDPNYSDNTASLLKKLYDDTDIEWKQRFSLNILITRQIYPPNSHSYVYVIQNATHYTNKCRICNDIKLVDMILTMILNSAVDISSFNTIGRNDTHPQLTVTTTNPKVSGPGPNENWLIYSIAYWFNGVRDKLNRMFGPSMFGGPIFQQFNFLDKIEEMNWMGIGGTNHNYDNTTDGSNNLVQPYINIGFVTMIPSIYEQLCSIYEKDDVVYDDNFGEYFIVEFILNLTRYYQGSDSNGNPAGIPTLTLPFNDIGPDNFGGSNPPDGINPFPTSVQPYEKQIIHTDDIDFDIKNIYESGIEFKEELIGDLTHRMNQRISENNRNNNVFTLNDDFARVLIIASGLTFNDDDNQEVSQSFSVQGTGAAEGVREPSTPIDSAEKLQSFITPVYSLKNQKLFELIISPLRKKRPELLEGITDDNINSYSEQLYDTLNNIRNGKIPVDENLKKIISEFMNSGKIPLEYGVPFNGYEEDDNASGGKIIKNKKTRRRMGRTRHKKHHKTNKKHKKHQTSCKNKTRKTKKAKRKNKTR